MNFYKRMAFFAGLIAVGYAFGCINFFSAVRGQEAESDPSDDAVKTIQSVHGALKAAVAQLKQESRYESATKGINSYAVMVGGLNVREDLESGAGVDPETFATLYLVAYDSKKLNIKDETLADWVDVNQLDFDEAGHLTYKTKVVRIFAVSRLKKLDVLRRFLTGDNKNEKKKQQ
ncbi:MAG: hypothetical protein NTW75_07625 [Planctomycetales bacterium]|nr:hypothetical protein [Planctomycetales bacterium]